MGALLGSTSVMAATRVSVAVTETIAGYNPYGDSVALMNSVWCQVYGCMMRYDPKKQAYTSDLFESWTTEDPQTWVFKLKPGLKRENGEPVVPADFVHSVERMRTDPQSRQAYRVSQIASIEARGDDSVVIKTKAPLATLPDYLTQVVVTSKAQWDAHGRDADREQPYGAGPYKLKRLAIDNYVMLEKKPDHPLISASNPDELVYRVIKEPEQRATALLNGEVQIAQFLPPQLVDRIENNPGTKVIWVDPVEMMFVAMRPSPPFDKKEVRQAVAYAIDRDAIIKYVLQGRATRLDMPIGPGQVGYAPSPARYPFDPQKARELLKQAGYPDGVAVDFYATVGRYVSDRQICEAIAQMLEAAGFKVNLKTPEWSTLWADVQKGNIPFYYMGRGTMTDPSVALQQYFETGGSPRIGFSNPEVDAALRAERQSFDPAERDALLRQAMSLIVEEAPAAFLWRHQMAWGAAKNIDFEPTPTGDAFGWAINLQAGR
ncbi:ABC transporter substrate-binding protein [Ancylobacter terrae]|uniref:ABC transporter substrate-binding protein n=1 Tax=Ancylobacter sp. sgz301288 TaxID=3342077 RepID=UPI00385F5CFD